MHIPHRSLRQLNNSLSLVVISVAVYIFAWPLWPGISWRLHHLHKQPSSSQLTQQVTHPSTNNKPSTPQQNTLVVPRINLTVSINEGTTLAALNTGTWHRPHTSTPDKGGNTVIAGHRFTYSGKSYFYNLDKVQRGDPLIVYWQGKQYTYQITDIKVVAATEVSVESNTSQTELTLYTCTPLWNPKDRLVLVATAGG